MRVLVNARIRTQWPERPFATAMAIDYGQVAGYRQRSRNPP